MSKEKNVSQSGEKSIYIENNEGGVHINSKIPKILIFLFIVLVLLFLFLIFKGRILDGQNIEPVEMVCDRKKDLGCTIDIEAKNYGDIEFRYKDGIIDSFIENDTSLKFSLDFKPTIIKSGSYKHSVAIDYNFKDGSETINFPLFKRDRSDNFLDGPYSMTKTKERRLEFSGEIKDFEEGRRLGWFNRNEFGVYTECGITWNKDSIAIEIMDFYGNICFFIEYKNDTLEYRGYFEDEGVFHIFSDDYYPITDKKRAKKIIKSNKPVFNHSGELGERMKY